MKELRSYTDIDGLREMFDKAQEAREASPGADSHSLYSDIEVARLAKTAFINAKRVELLETAMGEINDIRNDIVGRQNVNWSAHIYPLVAILNRCDFQGMSYTEPNAQSHLLTKEV